MVRIQWYLYLFSVSLVETRRQPLRNNKALFLIQSAPRNQTYCNHRGTLTLDASNEAVKGVKCVSFLNTGLNSTANKDYCLPWELDMHLADLRAKTEHLRLILDR